MEAEDPSATTSMCDGTHGLLVPLSPAFLGDKQG